MAELEAAQMQGASAEFKMPEKLADAGKTLDQSLLALAKIGGFDFLEMSIDGLKSMNPQRKALKKIFLTDAEKKTEREALKKRLELWMGLLSDATSVADAAEKANARAKSAEETLKKNQKIAVDACRELETNYRSLALFYKNAEADKLKNITIVNASLEQVADLDGEYFVKYVGEELKKNYDRLDLRDNYSLLCIPGYLGSNKVVDRWARMAHENKVMLVTDFRNYDSVDEVIDEFEASNLSGGDVY
jgi:hypothetical protein